MMEITEEEMGNRLESLILYRCSGDCKVEAGYVCKDNLNYPNSTCTEVCGDGIKIS